MSILEEALGTYHPRPLPAPPNTAVAGHVCAHVIYMCGACGLAHPPELRHAGPRFSRVSLARVPPKHWLGFPPLSERGCVPRGHDWGNHVGRRHVPSGESLYQGLGGGSSRGHNGGQGEESCKYNVSAATVTWSHCMEHMTKQICVHVSVYATLRALGKSLHWVKS